MFKDQNITLEYGGVRFEEPLLYFMEQHLRTGLPSMQQQAMNVVQDFMTEQAKREHVTISYNAKRTTYGAAQHLNIYEEFIVSYDAVARFKVYLEYANDPHHKIDASRTHDRKDKLALGRPNTFFASDVPMQEVIKKLTIFADQITVYGAIDAHGGGFWFSHEFGKSIIGIDLLLPRKEPQVLTEKTGRSVWFPSLPGNQPKSR